MTALLAKHRLRSSPPAVVNRLESPIYQLEHSGGNATERAVAAKVDPLFWSSNVDSTSTFAGHAAAVAARDAPLCAYTTLSRATRVPATSSSKVEESAPVEAEKQSAPLPATKVEESAPVETEKQSPSMPVTKVEEDVVVSPACEEVSVKFRVLGLLCLLEVRCFREVLAGNAH